MQTLHRFALPLALLVLGGCAAAPAKRDPRDPWERLNRSTYAFNDKLDHAIVRPVAQTYQKVTPQFLRSGVSNFFDNLHYTVVIVNDVLQFQVKDLFSDSGRFVLNSTLGIGGLFDPASSAGLDKNNRDFGQTLGKWGIGPGPYLMLPFLGPSDVRDAFGRAGDAYSKPETYLLGFWPSVGVAAGDSLDTRTRLLATESLLESAYDRYAFIRNAYLQHRQFLVSGGKPSKEQEEEEEQLLNEIDKENPPPPK
jgi:phospholipid-binding lipoprotein MlaA